MYMFQAHACLLCFPMLFLQRRKITASGYRRPQGTQKSPYAHFRSVSTRDKCRTKTGVCPPSFSLAILAHLGPTTPQLSTDRASERDSKPAVRVFGSVRLNLPTPRRSLCLVLNHPPDPGICAKGRRANLQDRRRMAPKTVRRPPHDEFSANANSVQQSASWPKQSAMKNQAVANNPNSIGPEVQVTTRKELVFKIHLVQPRAMAQKRLMIEINFPRPVILRDLMKKIQCQTRRGIAQLRACQCEKGVPLAQPAEQTDPATAEHPRKRRRVNPEPQPQATPPAVNQPQPYNPAQEFTRAYDPISHTINPSLLIIDPAIQVFPESDSYWWGILQPAMRAGWRLALYPHPPHGNGYANQDEKFAEMYRELEEELQEI
ncbi:hypothetical protein BCR34DRAFT_647521 [Clohesyomyces aquaticus]|uniref:Uncharacterized protein n=1 Tax=Clohesyomyces aquaticus TaxID=1231657 RepID=A0A1Y1ZUK9_9PLEO|nr:hypothetical protein BCR34DRAFT_647521 [Clohesyomyces aquaticus]